MAGGQTDAGGNRRSSPQRHRDTEEFNNRNLGCTCLCAREVSDLLSVLKSPEPATTAARLRYCSCFPFSFALCLCVSVVKKVFSSVVHRPSLPSTEAQRHRGNSITGICVVCASALGKSVNCLSALKSPEPATTAFVFSVPLCLGGGKRFFPLLSTGHPSPPQDVHRASALATCAKRIEGAD